VVGDRGACPGLNESNAKGIKEGKGGRKGEAPWQKCLQEPIKIATIAISLRRISQKRRRIHFTFRFANSQNGTLPHHEFNISKRKGIAGTDDMDACYRVISRR